MKVKLALAFALVMSWAHAARADEGGPKVVTLDVSEEPGRVSTE